MSVHIHIPDYTLYEDEFVIVINKPAGLMVEPDRNGYPNLLQQVKKYLKGSLPGEVYAQHIHRLDRPVSGIVLFTKDRSVLKNLSEQFAERKVRKYYQALTDNAPSQLQGTLDNWFRKEKKKAAIYDEPIEFTEKVVLHYVVKPIRNDRFLWDIELHTGKYHQIRAQLSHVGCPVVGDSLYGSTMLYLPEAIALHAKKLVFYHPITGEEISIERESAFAKQ